MAESLNPNDNPEAWEAAVLGREVDSFWDSTIGQYLLKRCLMEYNTALEAFLACDPADTMKVMTYQSNMRRANDFKEWLSTAITEGLRAEQLIDLENQG